MPNRKKTTGVGTQRHRAIEVTLPLLAAAYVGLLAPAATASVTWTHNYTVADGLGWTGTNGVHVSDGKIYVATGGGVSVSTDDGATWTNYTGTDGPRGAIDVYAIGDTIYAATYYGVSVSTDNGATWSNYTTADGLGADLVRGIYAVGNTIYAATDGGLSIGVISVPGPGVAGLATLGFAGSRRRRR